MMKINTIKSRLLAALTLLTTTAYPQTEVKTTEERVTKQDDQVTVSMNIILDEMNIGRNNMVVLTPVLRSDESKPDSLNLPPVIVAGRLQSKVLNRKSKLGNKLPFKTEPEAIIKKKKNKPQSFSYKTTVPYRPWMDGASLSVAANVLGCANCNKASGEQIIAQNILPKQTPATYKLTYIIPDAEPVKARSDRHTAIISFVVDRYELLRNYKDNVQEFARIDSVIDEIRGNQDLQITEFAVTGYASPEGGFEHNRILAENRANAFANYLVSRFGIERSKFTVKGFGEDWQGLRKAVAESSLADKQAILDIIDKEPNPDARDTKLKKLSNGEIYRILLNSYYPPLRRTEYVIAYIVRAFDVEEARKIIKTNPKLLSLNEMYLVAQSYPSNSNEFKEVFDIAARLYPDSKTAIVNSSAADIESGSLDVAITRLSKIEDQPEAWNNLGIAYILKGDMEKAYKYFSMSANEKDVNGTDNLKILNKMTGKTE